jgi:hypothetical protein
MTDRSAQLRAASARSRIKKREAGLRPHEHWYRDDEATSVAEFFRTLTAERQEHTMKTYPQYHWPIYQWWLAPDGRLQFPLYCDL